MLKKNCSITNDLLINCVQKSKNLDECQIFKIIFDKFCKKNIYTNNVSSK